MDPTWTMDPMGQSGPKQRTMDQIDLNGSSWTGWGSNGFKWTEEAEMDCIGLNYTKLDWIGMKWAGTN